MKQPSEDISKPVQPASPRRRNKNGTKVVPYQVGVQAAIAAAGL